MDAGMGAVHVISIAVFLLTAVVSLYALRRVTDVSPYSRAVKSRLVYGVPWGTLTITTVLVAVYVLLQGGYSDTGPVVVGYRSWSFAYPEAVFISSFAHHTTPHLLGNIAWFLVFGSLTEYAWGHYHADEGRSPFDYDRAVREGWLTNPIVRIGVFTGGVILYGVVSSLVTPGATIGASGIVFAVCGVAVFMLPKLSLVGIVIVEPVRVIVTALTTPVYTTTQATGMAVDVSFTTHLFGLLTGVLIAFILSRHRADTRDVVSPGMVAVAVLGFTTATGLYAFTQPVTANTTVVFHAIGAAFILTVVVFTALMTVQDRVVLIQRVDLSAQDIAVGGVICVVLALSVIGVVYNVVPVTSGTANASVEVNDHTVMYGENMDDAYATAFSTASVIDAPKQSGVIVTSADRNVWHVAVSAAELRRDQQTTVPVGGVGWREHVTVTRDEWHMPGHGPVYTVTATHNNEETVLYNSDSVTSVNRVNGNTVTIRAENGSFFVTVHEAGNGTGTGHETVRIPSAGESRTVGNITLERHGIELYATTNQTRVHIASWRPSQ